MDKDILIAEVLARPSLWNQKHPMHHHNVHLKKKWNEVAAACNSTEIAVKAQWKKLRATFKIKHDQMTSSRSGDGANMDDWRCNWPYYEAMLFLKDQFEPRSSSGNLKESSESDFDMNSPQPSPVSVPTPLPSPEVTLVDDTTFNSLLESIETHSQNESSQSGVPRMRKKKLSADTQQQLIELEKEKLQPMRDRSLKRNEERDPDADFFKKYSASNQAND